MTQKNNDNQYGQEPAHHATAKGRRIPEDPRRRIIKQVEKSKLRNHPIRQNDDSEREDEEEHSITGIDPSEKLTDGKTLWNVAREIPEENQVILYGLRGDHQKAMRKVELEEVRDYDVTTAEECDISK